MKRGVLVVLLIFLIIPLVNSLDLNLSLNQLQYGPLQQFNGYLNITSVYDIPSSTPLIAKIDNNELTRISIKDLLESNSILFNINESYYVESGGSATLVKNFNSRESFLFGVKIKNLVNYASLDILGLNLEGSFPKDVIIDIGNDHKAEYEYAGNFLRWSNPIYQEGISESKAPTGSAVIKNSKICEDINITLNELLNETLIEITANVQKVSDGGNLTASFDNIAECKLPEPGTTLTKVSCSVKIPNPSSGIHSICLYSKSSQVKDYYSMPVFEFLYSYSYYYNLRYAIYDTELKNKTTFSNNKFIDAINDYLGTCTLDNNNFCLIPINISSSSKGSISLDNLDIREESIKRSTLYNINQIPEKINFDYALINLETIPNLITPNTISKYKLTFNLNNKETSQDFNVTSLPDVSITLNKNFALENEEIKFIGESKDVIASWEWNFGDNSSAFTKEATHSYLLPGNYTIKLTVKTINNIKNSISKIIYIGALEDNIGSIINSNKNTIKKTKNLFQNQKGVIKDIYNIYLPYLDSSLDELDDLKSKYEETLNSNVSMEEKDPTYEDIFNKITNIEDTTPKSFFVISSFQTNAKISNIDDINPRIIDLPSTIEYKTSTYELNQRDVVINTNVYGVKIKYINDKEESKRLVKKQISINNGNNLIVLEDLNGLANICSTQCNPEEAIFLTKDLEIFNNNAAKFSNVNDYIEYIYLLPEGQLQDIRNTKTIVFKEPEITYECGNKVCEKPIEDSNWCPQDCKRGSSIWLILIPLLLGILALTYFFVKGKIHIKDIIKPNIFKNKVQQIVLENYVNSSLKKGIPEFRIRQALLLKGWTKKQIDEAFKRKSLNIKQK